jgi:hypothetical protein
MHTEVLFILALHSIAAVISFILALRDRQGFWESLRWGGIGFVSGLLGLIARSRTDRRHVFFIHIVQDAVLNLGLEIIALYGLPHLLA